MVCEPARRPAAWTVADTSRAGAAAVSRAEGRHFATPEPTKCTAPASVESTGATGAGDGGAAASGERRCGAAVRTIGGSNAGNTVAGRAVALCTVGAIQQRAVLDVDRGIDAGMVLSQQIGPSSENRQENPEKGPF